MSEAKRSAVGCEATKQYVLLFEMMRSISVFNVAKLKADPGLRDELYSQL